MKFPTQYDKLKIETNPGSRFAPVYAAEFDEDGRLVFEKVGEEDTFAFIQSHRESCDIKLILERFERGDVDVLNSVKGFYMDVVDMPKDYRGVLNLNIKTEQYFNSLPVEVKQEFNNSYSEFMVALGTEEWAERIRKIYEIDDGGLLDSDYSDNHDGKDDSAGSDG